LVGWGTAIAILDTIVREATLFAAWGFLLGGLDDLAIDLAYWWLIAAQPVRAGSTPRTLAECRAPEAPGSYAIFLPAWDESAVIATTLRNTLAVLDHPDFRIYVGAYPNDRATIDAALVRLLHNAVRMAAAHCGQCHTRLWPGAEPRHGFLNHAGSSARANAIRVAAWTSICRSPISR
jgi:hypothetical protein